MTSYRYLLAVDPSLTCSGWALFSVTDGEVKAVGKIRCEPPSIPMAKRLDTLYIHVQQLIKTLRLGKSDVLVCEAPTTMKDPHNALKVEQVRGIFECVGRSGGLRVPGRINPRTVQYEVMGLRGKQTRRAEVKAAAVRTVTYFYETTLARLGLEHGEKDLKRHQDIVDAILVGRVAVLRLQEALRGNTELESMFEGQSQQNRRTWRVRSCSL
jgi:Holliday junction resolvasome RuvABC endonuclease subunit